MDAAKKLRILLTVSEAVVNYNNKFNQEEAMYLVRVRLLRGVTVLNFNF
jgi:hypothetical protein